MQLPEREAETLQAAPERGETLDTTPDTEEAIEILVNFGEEESTRRET